MNTYRKLISLLIAIVFILSTFVICGDITVSAISQSNPFIKIRAGGNHTLAIRADGSLWAWGNNQYGQLGNGTLTNSYYPKQIIPSGVSDIAAGCYHSLAIKTDGSLWYWGMRTDGNIDTSPNLIIANGIKSVAAGFWHSLALKTDGSLLSWGNNNSGQLGIGTNIKCYSPITIIPSDVVQIAAGQIHSMAIKNDGSLWAWGEGVGDGTTNSCYTPKLIIDSDVSEIAAGYCHSFAIKTDGSLWGWGWNFYGQLGDGTDEYAPHLIPAKIIDNGVKMVAAGANHSLVVKTDGSLWACGENQDGQLGDGTQGSSNKSISFKKVIASGVKTATGGYKHSLALKTDNSVWIFGGNLYGQLGDRSQMNKIIPTELVDKEMITSKFAIISNESTDVTNVGSTGTFDIGSIMSQQESGMDNETYYKDFIKPLNKNIIKDMDNSQINASRQIETVQYAVGDTKIFWVYNIVYNSMYKVTATLKSSGTKSNVWVNTSDYNMSTADANKMTAEFDSKIYTKITGIFGQPSDVDKNGKINILCYDIRDGFSGSGGYVGGYFDPNDLFANNSSNPYSNYMEVFYIDTYPAMGIETKDVTKSFEILAHEFQHMVNFNQSVFIENNPDKDMDIWLNEALSEAAMQAYTGKVSQSRIDYYNLSTNITSGVSLLKWTGSLENYSLSYLFSQYLKEQAGIGDTIFTEVTKSSYNDYRAVEEVIKKHIDAELTFGQFMTNFRAALLLKNPTGPYGFKGNSAYNSISQKIYLYGKTNLIGGAAIVVATDPAKGEIIIPNDKGSTIKYLVVTDLPNGITDKASYSTDQRIHYFYGTATLNNIAYNSGSTISGEGSYTFINTISSSNIITYNFTIDRTQPIVNGISNGKTYSYSKTITFNEGTAVLNGNPFENGSTVASDGNYTLVVTDAAGNSTTVTFQIINNIYKFLNGRITGVGPETPVNQLKSSINIPENSVVSVLDKNSLEVSGESFVGTGMKVQFIEDSTITDSYTIVVYGDIESDGKINSLDLLKLKKHLLNMSLLTGVFLEASNTDHDSEGAVNSLDLIILKKHILNRVIINQ